MKKPIVTFLAAVFAVSSPYAVDFYTAVKSSNFVLDDSTHTTSENQSFGFSARITDKLADNLDGSILWDSDPVNGNLLSARASYSTSYLTISAGPSFGVLNTKTEDDEVQSLFQPGVGIGFTITVPGLLVAKADTDFALPPAVAYPGQAYLSDSVLSVGFFLPNVLCTLGASQKSRNMYTPTGLSLISATDYGFYTLAYKKGSPWRISVDFIYRILDHYIAPGSSDNRKLGNLVVGGGLEWAPKTDFTAFIKGNGALYTFSLGEKVTGLETFLFDVKAGISFQVEKTGAPASGK